MNIFKPMAVRVNNLISPSLIGMARYLFHSHKPLDRIGSRYQYISCYSIMPSCGLEFCKLVICQFANRCEQMRTSCSSVNKMVSVITKTRAESCATLILTEIALIGGQGQYMVSSALSCGIQGIFCPSVRLLPCLQDVGLALDSGTWPGVPGLGALVWGPWLGRP